MVSFQAMPVIAALAIVALALSSACQRADRTTGQTPGDASSSQSVPMSLTGTKWALVDLRGEAALPANNLAARPHLQFDAREQRVSGSTGVNRLSGPYEHAGDVVKFGDLATTKMAGPPELMAQESAFLKALGAAISIDAGENVLTLRDAAGNALARFEIMK